MTKLKTALLISLMMLLTGCSNATTNKVNNLEKEKEIKLEKSGYNACVKKVEESKKAEELCIISKLKDAGYADGVNCIEKYDTEPICAETNRYNAQVNADNECAAQFNMPSALNMADCYKLIQE